MKINRTMACIACGLTLFALAGCDGGSRKQMAASLNAPPGPKESKYTLDEAAKLRGQSPAAKVATDGGDKTDDKGATPGANDPSAGRVKAAPGVGAAGQDLGGGPLGQTFGTYFGIKEKLAFDLMENALKFYKGLNGGFPKSQAEFMDKIIKANGIKLPELPAGNIYEYDPKTGELYVAPAKDN